MTGELCDKSQLWLQSQPAHDTSRSPTSDRAHEKEKLDSLLKQTPASIRVVLGPRNCGKTATLVSYLQDKENIVYIDCRGIDTSSPTAFLEVSVSPLRFDFIWKRLWCVLVMNATFPAVVPFT